MPSFLTFSRSRSDCVNSSRRRTAAVVAVATDLEGGAEAEVGVDIAAAPDDDKDEALAIWCVEDDLLAETCFWPVVPLLLLSAAEVAVGVDPAIAFRDALEALVALAALGREPVGVNAAEEAELTDRMLLEEFTLLDADRLKLWLVVIVLVVLEALATLATLTSIAGTLLVVARLVAFAEEFVVALPVEVPVVVLALALLGEDEPLF